MQVVAVAHMPHAFVWRGQLMPLLLLDVLEAELELDVELVDDVELAVLVVEPPLPVAWLVVVPVEPPVLLVLPLPPQAVIEVKAARDAAAKGSKRIMAPPCTPGGEARPVKSPPPRRAG
jgi:hypothetical protein